MLHEAKLAPEKVNDFRTAYTEWRQAKNSENEAECRKKLMDVLQPSLDVSSMRKAMNEIKKEQPPSPSPSPSPSPFQKEMKPY